MTHFHNLELQFRSFFFDLKDMLINLKPPEVIVPHPPTPLLDYYLSDNSLPFRSPPNFNYIRDYHKPKLTKELEKLSGTLVHRYWLVAGVNYVLGMANIAWNTEPFFECRTYWERVGKEFMAYIYGLHDWDFYFEEPEPCPNCMETVFDPQETLCGHTFCFKCYMQWRRENDACPVCRQDMD